MRKETLEPVFDQAWLARQPVFDLRKQVWGFELLYREHPGDERAVFNNEEQQSESRELATLRVAACALLHRLQLTPEQRLLINFPLKAIVEDIPRVLPLASTVLEIEEIAKPGNDVLEALRHLRSEGCLVAIDGYKGQPGCEALLEVADILKVDVLGESPMRLKKLLDKHRSSPVTLLAKRVEDYRLYTLARVLGFTLFQGYFFRRPEVVDARRLSSSESARLRLFRLIEHEDPDLEAVARSIEADAGLSYRLLTYLNSPAMSLREEIESIEHAVAMLGWKQLRSWLRVVLLTDLTPPEKTSELPILSAQRARFLQLAAGRAKAVAHDSEALFLLGLFSLLDAMLSLPMKDLVLELPLSEELKACLRGEVNACSPWLELAAAFEDAAWDRVDELLSRLGLSHVAAARAYNESLTWAVDFFQGG